MSASHLFPFFCLIAFFLSGLGLWIFYFPLCLLHDQVCCARVCPFTFLFYHFHDVHVIAFSHITLYYIHLYSSTYRTYYCIVAGRSHFSLMTSPMMMMMMMTTYCICTGLSLSLYPRILFYPYMLYNKPGSTSALLAVYRFLCIVLSLCLPIHMGLNPTPSIHALHLNPTPSRARSGSSAACALAGGSPCSAASLQQMYPTAHRFLCSVVYVDAYVVFQIIIAVLAPFASPQMS